jgi:hypothetical protein
MAVFVFYQRCSRIPLGSGNDPLSHFMKIGGRNGLGECQLLCEYRGYTDFAWLNVDVGGNDRARRVVYTFALQGYE